MQIQLGKLFEDLLSTWILKVCQHLLKHISTTYFCKHYGGLLTPSSISSYILLLDMLQLIKVEVRNIRGLKKSPDHLGCVKNGNFQTRKKQQQQSKIKCVEGKKWNTTMRYVIHQHIQLFWGLSSAIPKLYLLFFKHESFFLSCLSI